jgi:hypothetical protein
LEQGKTHEERKVIDASPAAITLAMLMTDRSWTRWRRWLERGNRGCGRSGGQMSQALNRLRAMEPAQVFPPMPRRPSGDRERMA